MKQSVSKQNHLMKWLNVLLIAVLVVVTGAATLPVSAASTSAHPVGLYLEDLEPERAKLNAAPFTLTLEGQGFVSGALVEWETTELTPTSVSDHKIKVDIGASLLAAAGTFHIAVKNPDGTLSNSKHFKVYIPPAMVPQIKRLNPAKVNVEVGATGTFELKIYGKNFDPAAQVNWYDPITTVTTPLTKVGDCTPQLCTVTVDKALIGQKNIAKITVVNGTVSSNPKSLPIVLPRPVLTSMDPSSANAGSAAVTLNLVGDRFQADSIVKWDDKALPGPVTFVDAQHILIVVPAEFLVHSGEFDVSVSNPGTGHSRELEFHVLGSTPEDED
jgi:hypothetical protein